MYQQNNNNQIPTCPIHGVPFVRKQGISKKTNQPYDFLSCPEKDNQGNYCNGGRIKPHDQLMNALRIMMATIQQIEKVVNELAKRP